MVAEHNASGGTDASSGALLPVLSGAQDSLRHLCHDAVGAYAETSELFSAGHRQSFSTPVLSHCYFTLRDVPLLATWNLFLLLKRLFDKVSKYFPGQKGSL